MLRDVITRVDPQGNLIVQPLKCPISPEVVGVGKKCACMVGRTKDGKFTITQKCDFYVNGSIRHRDNNSKYVECAF